MVAASVRAVYEKGNLLLLDPVDLAEGEQVRVRIERIVEPVTEEDYIRAALGDLVVHWPDPTDDSDAWVEELAEDIALALQGSPSLSEIVIEDRGEL